MNGSLTVGSQCWATSADFVASGSGPAETSSPGPHARTIDDRPSRAGASSGNLISTTTGPPPVSTSRFMCPSMRPASGTALAAAPNSRGSRATRIATVRRECLGRLPILGRGSSPPNPPRGRRARQPAPTPPIPRPAPTRITPSRRQVLRTRSGTPFSDTPSSAASSRDPPPGHPLRIWGMLGRRRWLDPARQRGGDR